MLIIVPETAHIEFKPKIQLQSTMGVSDGFLVTLFGSSKHDSGSISGTANRRFGESSIFRVPNPRRRASYKVWAGSSTTHRLKASNCSSGSGPGTAAHWPTYSSFTVTD